MKGTGFSVEMVIREGDPATVICELATARSASLIAMHTSGRNAFTHLTLSSVAERVVPTPRGSASRRSEQDSWTLSQKTHVLELAQEPDAVTHEDGTGRVQTVTAEVEEDSPASE